MRARGRRCARPRRGRPPTPASLRSRPPSTPPSTPLAPSTSWWPTRASRRAVREGWGGGRGAREQPPLPHPHPPPALFADGDPAAWTRTMAVNYGGAVHAARAAVGGMVAARRGRLVFVASLASFLGGAASSAYAASKHAIVGLADSMRLEVGGSGAGRGSGSGRGLPRASAGADAPPRPPPPRPLQLQGAGVSVHVVVPDFVDTPMLTRALAGAVRGGGGGRRAARARAPRGPTPAPLYVSAAARRAPRLQCLLPRPRHPGLRRRRRRRRRGGGRLLGPDVGARRGARRSGRAADRAAPAPARRRRRARPVSRVCVRDAALARGARHGGGAGARAREGVKAEKK